MGNVLGAVVQMKQLEHLEQQANQKAAESVITTLMKSQELSAGIKMKRKELDIDLAGKGLKFGAEGEIERAPELVSEFETLIKSGKAAGAKGELREEGILADIEAGRPLTSGKQKIYRETMKGKVNTQTQKALEALGVHKTQKEALDDIEQNRSAMELNQVDVDFLVSQVKEKLPETVEKEPNWFERIFGK